MSAKPRCVDNHEFIRFMDSVKKELAEEYERITRRSAEDPGTAGDQAEENWAAFFRDWLPPSYPIVTKGRLVNEKGLASPQFDVLVLHPSYPKKLRDKKLYFAAGVVAAFECKLTLRKSDVPKVFLNVAKTKRLLDPAGNTPFDNLHQAPIVGLLSHAHGLGGNAFRTLYDLVRENGTAFAEHPREMLDIICVGNLVTLVLQKGVHVKPHMHQEAKAMVRDIGVREGVSTIYMGLEESIEYADVEYADLVTGQIFGCLVHSLFRQMAYRDASLRPLSGYLENVRGWGGIGSPVMWGLDVLPKEIVRRLRAKGYEDEEWGKWCEDFWML